MRILANGVDLYCEVRGAGPPLLLVMGATGDAGHLERVAALLAAGFTVVTYDRRGNGRSGRPAGWASTSAEEQADDAAALLRALGATPAHVFGTSSGGTVALCLVLRHPEAVRGAVLHEPVLPWLYDRPVGAADGPGGDETAALERFWRVVAGEAGWEALDERLRGRMLDSAGTFLRVEAGAFDAFTPTDDALADVSVPVRVLVSEDGLPFLHQAAGRLAERLGLPVVARTAGTHTPYADHPEALADAIRSLL